MVAAGRNQPVVGLKRYFIARPGLAGHSCQRFPVPVILALWPAFPGDNEQGC